jgi:molybdenum cofactor synthesis domain-containing protein
VIPLDDVRAEVLAHVEALPAEVTPLESAAGLVLAEVVRSAGDVPPFPNAAVDGLAVRAADTLAAGAESPVSLRVVGRAMAGGPSDAAVGPGEAIRIMTGAVVPDGADALVMVEDTQPDPAASDRVLVGRSSEVGRHIRGAGEDLVAGQQVAPPGRLIRPVLVGVLASAGAVEVLAHPRPRVGVLATGAELVSDGSVLAPGQIRDSNRPALLATVAAAGFEAVNLGVCADDDESFAEALRAGAERCDAVVTSGGVSMGEADVVRAVLGREPVGGWAQVAIKPAKPFAWAVVDGGRGRPVPVLGLPGNPVSVLVSFELLARPVLRRLAGHGDGDLVRPTLSAVAGEAMPRRPDGKVHFVRVTVEERDGRRVVRSSGGQGSHQLAALAEADGLAVLTDGDAVAAGDPVGLLDLRS